MTGDDLESSAILEATTASGISGIAAIGNPDPPANHRLGQNSAMHKTWTRVSKMRSGKSNGALRRSKSLHNSRRRPVAAGGTLARTEALGVSRRRLGQPRPPRLENMASRMLHRTLFACDEGRDVGSRLRALLSSNRI